jgi:dimethylargininase
MSATALIRHPSSHLDEGIVSHIERQPVDVARVVEQWEGYVAALRTAGWDPFEVPPAEGCPDSVFVEDTMVVFGGTAVIARRCADLPVRDHRRSRNDVQVRLRPASHHRTAIP